MQGCHHQVACEGRLDSCFCRFQVAGLANEQHVRVLTHEGAQGRTEVKALVAVDLGLGDARQGVFDWIFNRGDIYPRIVALGQQCIEGRGFARSSWPGYQQHAVGLGSHLPQGLAGLPIGDQGVQAQLGGPAVQQAQADLLAVAPWQGADAEIHLPTPEHAPDAAVLGQATLGYVELSHDLDAGGDRRSEAFGQVFKLFLQHAVEAEAHLQGVFLGFNVDVTRPGGEGFDQDSVHQADDWRGRAAGPRGGAGLQIFNLGNLLELARARAGDPQFLGQGSGRSRWRTGGQQLAWTRRCGAHGVRRCGLPPLVGGGPGASTCLKLKSDLVSHER